MPEEEKPRKRKRLIVIILTVCTAFILSLAGTAFYLALKRPHIKFRSIKMSSRMQFAQSAVNIPLTLQISIQNNYFFPVSLGQTSIEVFAGENSSLLGQGSVQKISVDAGKKEIITFPFRVTFVPGSSADEGPMQMLKQALWKVNTRVLGFIPLWINGKGFGKALDK